MKRIIITLSFLVLPQLIWASVGKTISFKEQLNLEYKANKFLHQENFKDVKTILDDALEKKTKCQGDSYLYEELIRSICERKDYLKQSDRWLQADPSSHFAHLIRAYMAIRTAYEARGGGYAHTVTQQGGMVFRQELHRAQQLLEKAAELNPKDPAVPAAQIDVARGLGLNQEVMESYFKKAIENFPDYYTAYENKRTYLLPKWHGNNMVEFQTYAWNIEKEAIKNKKGRLALFYVDFLIKERLMSDPKTVEHCEKIYKDHLKKHKKSYRDMITLAKINLYKHQPEEAIKIYKKILKHNVGYYDLALLYKDLKKTDLAEKFYQKGADYEESQLGREHPRLIKPLNELATLLKDRDAFEDAKAINEKIFEISEMNFGFESEETMRLANNLAVLYQDMEEPLKAAPIYERIIHTKEKLYGMNHPSLGAVFGNLGHLYNTIGHPQKAVEVLDKAVMIDQQMRDHHGLGYDLTASGTSYEQLGLLDKAEQNLSQAIEIRKQVSGMKGHVERLVADSTNILGGIYTTKNELKKARQAIEEAYEIRKGIFEHGDLPFAASHRNFGWLSIKEEEYHVAENHFLDAISIYEANHGQDNHSLASPKLGLATVYRKRKNYKKAEKYLKQAEAIYSKIGGEDSLDTASCHLEQGLLLGMRKKYDQANDLFDKAIETYSKQDAYANQRLHEALNEYKDLLVKNNKDDLVNVIEEKLNNLNSQAGS